MPGGNCLDLPDNRHTDPAVSVTEDLPAAFLAIFSVSRASLSKVSPRFTAACFKNPKSNGHIMAKNRQISPQNSRNSGIACLRSAYLLPRIASVIPCQFRDPLRYRYSRINQRLKSFHYPSHVQSRAAPISSTLSLAGLQSRCLRIQNNIIIRHDVLLFLPVPPSTLLRSVGLSSDNQTSHIPARMLSPVLPHVPVCHNLWSDFSSSSLYGLKSGANAGRLFRFSRAYRSSTMH